MPSRRSTADHILSIDIGGSGIKSLVLDERGTVISERLRVETPKPATPARVLAAIVQMAQQHPPFTRIAVGFPGVVKHGVVKTAPNLAPSWCDTDLLALLRRRLGKPARVLNDAGVQGLGAIRGRGVELVITLGTGFGSALFLDGRYVTSLELGHHPFRRGRTYEETFGRPALRRLGPKRWSKRLHRAIATLEHVFNYDRLYIGGGNAKKIIGTLPENVSIVPNVAGLLGGIALWRREADEL